MTQTGTLDIRVYTSNGFIPVPGATVLITRSNGPKPELVSIQFTDESGLAHPITVQTPPLSNSQQPDGGVGWTSLDILVEHPEYERMLIEGVQVFPGEQTIQEVQLIPLAQFPEEWDRTEDVEITPQDL